MLHKHPFVKNTKPSPCLTASNDATTPLSHKRFFWLRLRNRFLFRNKNTGDKIMTTALITDIKVGQTFKTSYFTKNQIADVTKLSNNVFKVKYVTMVPSVIQGEYTAYEQEDIIDLDWKQQAYIKQAQITDIENQDLLFFV